MKPDITAFSAACPGVDESFLVEHLARLSDRYFSRFDERDLCRHATGLAGLSPQSPVEVLLDLRRDGSLDCTVLAFDYPSEFSLLTGILAGMGFSVDSGDVFTYGRVLERSVEAGLRTGLAAQKGEEDLLQRRRIIDHFSGSIETPLSFQAWAADLREKLRAAIGLLEGGGAGSVREAKQRVNEMVVKRLAHLHEDARPLLYPVQLEIDNEDASFTRLKVTSEDTPAFLYALSTALSLHDISIEHVRIRTIRGRVEDQLDLVDSHGRKILDPHLLGRVRLSVLLTKQFTTFLGRAPDPLAALSRFEHLLEEMLRKPAKEDWLELLTNPHALQDLARLLGASDFLWEDFIRVQYESLLPMLQPYVSGRRLAEPIETLPERMEQTLKGARSPGDREKRLNEFKDREIFLIDLDHILNPGADLQALSRGLTSLAEVVLNRASSFVYEDLVRRFGPPRTVAGLDARYAILGLGKLGGAALGYASDIELLLVYSDSGITEGRRPIANSEFFDRLVKGVVRFIRAKREGIFHVDLRLRPYGNAGPLACSLESFCRYYAPDGPAHAYERLALVCLRAVGSDRDLGSRVERLRDEMIYFGGPLDLRELLDLRERQFKEKTEGGKLNAKFSPGGLVDIEYGVQILQVTCGKDFPQLRTPHINEALAALHGAGVLSEEETRRLSEAYRFLRQLINGMRMLRGSARDLFLPSVESNEFAHLARRMGYQRGGPLDPQEQLRIDFEKHTATARAFIERHFGRDSLPGPGVGTVADLILGDRLPRDMTREILAHAGFRDPERAYANMKGLAGSGIRRERFAEIALLAFDTLRGKADPDMALNNWERYIHALGSPEFHYSVLLSQPMRLEILLGLFAGSQFLADTLIRNPGFLDWVVMPENLHKPRHREEIEEEGKRLFQGSGSRREWLNRLRRLRRREMLRIGTRDICLQVPLREIVFDLSALAEALIQVVLEETFDRLEKEKTSARDKNLRDRFCIAAFGKLGGNELNYSSDIDLLGLWDDGGASRDPGGGDYQDYKALFSKVMEDVTSDLSIHTEEGRAYRVDLRLRPFGREGELVPSLSALIDYYRRKASLWEIQAALKIRPVAGNLKLGYAFLREMRPLWLRDRNRSSVVEIIERMRHEAIKAASSGTVDVKSGLGGLRDVEFLVQGLQLIHAPKRPELLEGNTMTAIDLLHEAGILPGTAALPLKEDYVFLRRVEHCLQLLDDRQVHVIPSDQSQLDALAKRMLGIRGEAEGLMERLSACRGRIRKAYADYLLEGKG